jgi:signal transduction histidine kinase
VLPHIFERFSRAGSTQGLGLGLYLAHRIAVAHRGSLSVSSPPGEGASFYLYLPLETVEADRKG